MSKGILYDATLCIGCKMCEKGCAERNGLPYDDTIAAESQAVRTQIHSRSEQRRQIHAPPVHELRGSQLRFRLSRRRISQDRRRSGHLRRSRCMGCRYCMLACPFFVPEVRMGQDLPAGPQVRHVLRTAWPRACKPPAPMPAPPAPPNLANAMN